MGSWRALGGCAIGARERVRRVVRDRSGARRGLEITPPMGIETFARLAVPKVEIARRRRM